jgi:hypothetical protein
LHAGISRRRAASTAALCLKMKFEIRIGSKNLVLFFFFLNLLFCFLVLVYQDFFFFKQQIHQFVSQWGRFDIFITRATSINYPNVQHQSRKAALMLPGARDTTYILTSIPA